MASPGSERHGSEQGGGRGGDRAVLSHPWLTHPMVATALRVDSTGLLLREYGDIAEQVGAVALADLLHAQAAEREAALDADR